MSAWVPGALIIMGLGIFATAKRSAAAVQKRRNAGIDRFLDEQLNYRAYPWLVEARTYRVQGALIAVGGVIVLALDAWAGRF